MNLIVTVNSTTNIRKNGTYLVDAGNPTSAEEVLVTNVDVSKASLIYSGSCDILFA